MNNSRYIKETAKATSTNAASAKYNSWLNVARALDKTGFATHEAEAILGSDLPLFAWETLPNTKRRVANSTTLLTYLKSMDFGPRSAKTNMLVFEKFGKKLGLELNEEGIPCRRGNVVCGGTSILVPLGTPLICDPTSETYWSS